MKIAFICIYNLLIGLDNIFILLIDILILCTFIYPALTFKCVTNLQIYGTYLSHEIYAVA